MAEKEELKEAAAFKAIVDQLTALNTTNQLMMNRLTALEGSKTEIVGEKVTQVQVQNTKEKSLSLTFGDSGCSPNSLRLFLDHFNIAKKQNMMKEVGGWNDAEFRANELRFQLRGEAALWISQENAMLRPWTRDDEELIAKLKDRFMGTQSIELNIIAFEELSQNDNESLAQYMTKCQHKGYDAFGGLNEPLGTQQRIVWKFLSGIRDADVRNAVIKEKWMKSATEAKQFEEVLMIAETARLNKTATAATGTGGVKANIAAVSKVKERRSGQYTSRTPHTSSDSNKSYSSSRSSGSTASGNSKIGINFKCHYCETFNHYGGWKMCKERELKDPDWTPGKPKKGFQ